MGRLTLNILLSFAQFEREVIGERIRDKVAASRRKGIWMGGWAPLGYDVKERKLLVNDAEATLVRSIFTRYSKGVPPIQLLEGLLSDGETNKQGKPIDKGYLYRVLNNRVYIEEAVHKGVPHPGEHQAIIERNLWDRVHVLISASPAQRTKRVKGRTPAILKGLIFAPTGVAMTPAHTRKSGRLYCYYVSIDLLKNAKSDCPIRRVSAAQVEDAVLAQIQTMVLAPEIVVAAWRIARRTIKNLTERQARQQMENFAKIWNELFPVEQARLVQLLVVRVDIALDGINIKLRTDGLGSIIQDLLIASERKRDAA